MNKDELLEKLVEISTMPNLKEMFTKNDPDSWTNFWEMCEDIKKHTANNQSEVESTDFPMELKLGFTCKNTGKVWKIGISSCMKSLNEGDQVKANLIKTTLKTGEGKINLAKSLSFIPAFVNE
jgi:hypothetical protein